MDLEQARVTNDLYDKADTIDLTNMWISYIREYGMSELRRFPTPKSFHKVAKKKLHDKLLALMRAENRLTEWALDAIILPVDFLSDYE